MVFFSCDGCAEMLKKSQVDSHVLRCRVCSSLSCVDCNVSFYGDDFRAHTSCLTEAERYEGKKVNPRKKRSPQDVWMDTVSRSVPKCPNHLRPHLQTIVSLSNVPRKEKPFRNFVANSVKGLSSSATSELWLFLQSQKAAKVENQPVKPPPGEKLWSCQEDKIKTPPENTTTTDNAVSTKSVGSGGHECIDKKALTKRMKKVLRKHKVMSLKDLRKSLHPHFSDHPKSVLKATLKRAIRDGKKFLVEGESVSLRS